MKSVIRRTIGRVSPVGIAIVLAGVFMSYRAPVAHAGAPLPVTVGTVNFSPTSPIVRANDTGNVIVSATVTVTFDSSGTTSSSKCAGKTKTDTTITTTVTPSLSVTASDGPNSTSLTGSNGGSFSGSLPDGPEGKTTVTVSASASETVSTTTQTTTTVYSTNGCTGTITSGPTTDTKSSSDTRAGSGSNSASYLVDLTAPTATAQITGQSTIKKQQFAKISVDIAGGSAGTAFSINLTLTSDSNPSFTIPDPPASDSGNFAPSNDGIVPIKNAGPIGIKIPCDAPLGTYTAKVTVHTVDLAGNSWPDITPPNLSFTIEPAIELESETLVVAEIGGDYDNVTTFTAAQAKKSINTNPGSFHIAEIITFGGACLGAETVGGIGAVLQIPTDFSYLTTGASPIVHVFEGTGNVLDLHTPTGFVEVTSLVTQTPPNAGSITLDLSALGEVPTDTTIYIRAHIKFSATLVPAANFPYTFNASDSVATVDSVSFPLTNSSSYVLTANPN